MADFYLDISAVGNEYQAYSDTPGTWAVPQDGNGKAGPGHSAAVAIATIDVAGCSASGTGTIGVLGVTVSSTLNASGAALATAIANAINASATAVTSTYSALLLPLNKLVFARVNPGLNTQVQIMLRISGADWNGMSPTQANVSPAATIGAFAGGADGPFAYAATTATVFGKTALTYGCWFAASAGPTEPAADDITHVRTRRGGADITMSITTANVTATWRNRQFLYDDGTVWVGDNGTFTVNLTNTTSSSQNIVFNTASGGTIGHFSRSKYGLDVRAENTSSSSAYIAFVTPVGNGARAAFVRCKLSELAGNAGAIYLSRNASNISYWLDASESLLEYTGGIGAAVFELSSIGTFRFRLNCLRVAVVAASGPIGTVVHASSSTVSGSIEWIGGEVYDTNGVFRCQNPVSVNSACPNVEVTLDGVGGVTEPAVGFSSAAPNALSKLVWSMTQGPNRGFRYETPTFTTDWKGDGTFPHCGAQNLQGDLWSHRVTWGAVSSVTTAATALRLGYFHRAASAVRTLTCELYVPDSATIYADELEFSIAYQDSSDVWRNETFGAVRAMQLAASGRSALASSAKSWTTNGVAAHSAKKIELTTQHAVKQNSEILIRLTLVAPRSPAVTFFVSPEVSVV